MSGITTVLITGSKAGIGKGLLEVYASRPDTIAIAAIRDEPTSTPAKELQTIPTGKGSKIVVAKYDAGSPTAAKDLIEYLQAHHQVDHLDVVIANAGILKHFGPAREVKPEELHEHLLINTIAPISLYQHTANLLDESTQEPKFFIVSSNIGSNTLLGNYPMPMIAYGLSKAAVNFAAGKMNQEESKIIVVPVQPGWVQTAMGEKAASFIGMDAKEVPVTLETSIAGLIKVFDSATKAETSGKFWDQNGEIVPW
jgi:norsolorinic acid ketoreductase